MCLFEYSLQVSVSLEQGSEQVLEQDGTVPSLYTVGWDQTRFLSIHTMTVKASSLESVGTKYRVNPIEHNRYIQNIKLEQPTTI